VGRAAVAVKLRRRSRLRPGTGMVRVSKDELIVLLQRSLLATQLEAEARQLKATGQGYLRAERARELLGLQARCAGVPPEQVADVLLTLPLTAANELHEAAFAAMVGHSIQACRFGASIPSIGDPR
jgi:hypothetical protein